MTTHKIIVGNSDSIPQIKSKSINLIITSPPYPMISMWDGMFVDQDPMIDQYLKANNGYQAFLAMHSVLNKTWEECDRILTDGGYICINIGDSTRTINGNFRLYPNHSQIINFFLQKGYDILPDIHWHKPSNAPNKYMGSGMYPAGAYVTYEHEYILIFRKIGKRSFSEPEKEIRRKSAYFWEERNVWFSDLWDVKGTAQKLGSKNEGRERSAAYPLEIPYRLVNMFSIEGDTILDPFAGLGTTNLACMLAQRNSIGIEIHNHIATLARKTLQASPQKLNTIIEARIAKHLDFIELLPEEKREKCYRNQNHNFLVKTKQEVDMRLDMIDQIDLDLDRILCTYKSAEFDDTP